MLRCKVQRSMRGSTEGGLSSNQWGLRTFVTLEEKGGFCKSNPSPTLPCEQGRERRLFRVGWGERQRSPTSLVRGVGVCTPTYACSR